MTQIQRSTVDSTPRCSSAANWRAVSEGDAEKLKDVEAVAMREIVSGVHRVTSIISEIGAATTEQSNGIAHVNGSVAQLDQMTQQNAALVEQSAAAAGSLRGQARALADSVAAFRLESAPA